MKRFGLDRLRHFDEAGDTLIEVLFTLVILGLCSAGLLAAFSTSLSASAEQRGLVTLNTLVRDGAAQLNTDFQSSPADYVSCANSDSYDGLIASLPTPPPGYNESISVESFLGSSGGYDPTLSDCGSSNGSTAPQLVTFTVGGPYSTGGSTSFVVQDIHPAKLPPVKLIFLSSSPVSGTASASATVGPVTVEEVDQFNDPSDAPETVSLASTSGTSEFTTSSGTPITSVSIASGSSSAQFYYGDTHAGPSTITASANGLTSATLQVTISAGLPSKLVLTTPVSGAATGSATLGKITVTEYDQFNNLTTAFETVNLTSTSAGVSEFATSSGGTTVISVTIPSGSSFAQFYYGDTRAGNPTITASASGLTSATQQETIIAGPAKTLALTTPVSGAATASATLGKITLTEYDQFNNLSTTAETVNLASNSPGTKEFATTSGGTAVTSVSIPGGSSFVQFYYGDTHAGAPTITASASGLTSATQQETIIAGVAAKLILTTPGSGPASASASLGPITVTEFDQFNNLSSTAETVSLASNSPGTKEFAASLNGTAVGSVAISAGSSSTTFYYGDTLAGTPTITAAATGLTSATQQETVTGASLPSISSPTAASPETISKKSTTATFTITGTGFAGNASVTISGAVVKVTSTTFNSSTSITVTVSSTKTAGTFNLTVTNPGVGSQTSNGSVVVS